MRGKNPVTTIQHLDLRELLLSTFPLATALISNPLNPLKGLIETRKKDDKSVSDNHKYSDY